MTFLAPNLMSHFFWQATETRENKKNKGPQDGLGWIMCVYEGKCQPDHMCQGEKYHKEFPKEILEPKPFLK